MNIGMDQACLVENSCLIRIEVLNSYLTKVDWYPRSNEGRSYQYVPDLDDRSCSAAQLLHFASSFVYVISFSS